ncbi:MAG: FAD-dependent oxidoreductase [Actinobacteria bacterium]|nr:FAD-dependent oxidoreductase [Actinomycetota bacterium]
MDYGFDAIVVGAGPAGTSAAYTMAAGGMRVAVLERGEYPGAKNVMGGVLYRRPTESVIPGFWKEAPLERPVTEHRLWLLSRDAHVGLSFKDSRPGAPGPGAPEPEAPNGFTVLRAGFDRWFAERAKEKGALIVNEVVVTDLVRERGRVVGVTTDRPDGELRAPLVIVADGANSLVTERSGLRPRIKPDRVALAVKEIIALPREKIDDRFNLESGEGATIEMAGDATKGMVGTAFVYTNRDSLSIGVGAILAQYRFKEHNPQELIEALKNHPSVRPLIQGGRTVEYMAHWIPEGGLRDMPQLYDHGVMVAGDAAQMVNAVRREGSNMAIVSGRLAGETALAAHEKGDFSSGALAAYRERLEESFIMKDLRKYRRVIETFLDREELFEVYPDLLGDAARGFLSVDGVPKAEKQREIWRRLRRGRGLVNMAGDAYALYRALL